MCKLSIIVPVYNSEKRLEKCLNSLICQMESELEIVIINDGSTDRSDYIIKDYIKKYPDKIQYYAKENTGIADTRNFGIEKAKGKYIAFVDSDDYIDFDLVKMLEKYMQADIDLIKFKLERVDIDGKAIQRVDGPIFHKITGEEGFNLLAFEDVLLDSPCVYFFKKSLFTQNQLKFSVGTEHEDFGLIPLIIVKAKTMVSVPNYGYYYVQSPNSITRNEDYAKTLKKFEDVLFHYENMISFIEKEPLQPQTKKNMKTYYTNAIILKLKELNKKDQKRSIQEVKKRKMINNIQVHTIKQFLKKCILRLNVAWYLKLK